MTPEERVAQMQVRIRELESEVETLRFEKETLERVTQSVGAGIACISRDYKTLWANRVVTDFFGDVVGKPCHLTYNGKESVCPGCGVREVFDEGKTFSTHEQPGYDAHGNEIWTQLIATPLYDKKGRVESAIEVVMPITERKQAELAAQRERRFSDALINSLPGVMYLLDAKGRLCRWNRNLEVVCGCGPDEMKMEALFDFIALRDRERSQREFSKIFSDGEGVVETHLASKDGQEIPYLLSGVVVRFHGEPHVVGTGMDMTRRLADARQKEGLIKKLKESLARVRTLSGMLPICSSCKKVRDDKGYWNQIESYIKDRSEAEFSHAICPDCLVRLYPAEAREMERRRKEVSPRGL